VEEAVAVAERTPLTPLIERHLPPGGPLLEAGCGLGQYVLLLRARGHAAVGVDWSLEAVRKGSGAGAPLAVMDLRALGVRDGSVATYLSLGAAEHDPDGPHRILAEAARVLRPGGVLLVSVPYWNSVRRLFAPFILRRNNRIRLGGGQFYQFAFTRREFRTLLGAHGFALRALHPYDPGRLLRKSLGWLARRFRPGRGVVGSPGRGGVRSVPDGERPRAWARWLAGRLLYTAPMLRLFGHMILAVAIKR
jgi:SAM-dependent methyltransferase